MKVNTLRVGDTVKIRICNPYDNTVTPGMIKYNGLITQVSKVCGKTITSATGVHQCRFYELEGVVSDAKAPYSFTREMLIAEGEEA